MSKKEAAKQFVEMKIHGKKVVVFSKTYCPYCSMAKNALKPHVGKEIKPDQYEVIEIENRPDCSEIQAWLRQLTGASSVPRVFINGQCIGGGDETSALESSGQLSVLLRS